MIDPIYEVLRAGNNFNALYYVLAIESTKNIDNVWKIRGSHERMHTFFADFDNLPSVRKPFSERREKCTITGIDCNNLKFQKGENVHVEL